MSHPAWVCGLKPPAAAIVVGLAESHPAWVCGLKPDRLNPLPAADVTPCVGVWIETFPYYDEEVPLSHTLRGCVD